MFAATALFLVALAGPADLRALEFAPPSLAMRGEVFDQSPWVLDVGLRSHRFGLDGRALNRSRWLAQAATRATDATPSAGAATPPTAAGGEGCESCDIDCETCRESDRQARYVLRRRAATLRTHRAFGIATWGMMVLTEALGTALAVNQATWWGGGNCIVDNRTVLLGRDLACNGLGLQGIHETAAFLTVGLYTTTAILGIAAPDPENASVGDDTASRTLRLHKSLAWIHGIGMIALPILGALTVHPELFYDSMSPTYSDHVQSYQRAMRSIHTAVGYTTLAALSFAMYLELF